ncbi:MAG TPA: RagB/SusD family nutrient uptake outer membrane protein [Cyclobacteriaceae bacterium]|nr:RagB/SusD family nutrient uptake outer membrane protein [Cyclobacteriaceae bacterium]HMV08159.1 RagB/SusD family nutrient uptake outer membrane protein [Cyclobacteriaceae bacterium]HMX00800.1 RagB/SusD family nutrient uptake outer membrane protein [Cyclobacteriaceae bacterium]HMX49325.1 RagB/SusD family nutrient uptake outer membrane protein [Cyclobacteriaceae bacterium]HMY93603.1 RagB/SusD family nutrient uptake outer membrane protein [Cyclobacteriaceae bacterium]
MKRILILVLLICFSSCSDEFLEKKSDKSIIIPTTYKDLQSLLDNNVDAFNIDPSLGFIGSDDYTIEEMYWEYLYTAVERNGYTWNAEIYEGETGIDWNTPYKQVFYCNVILERLTELNPSDAETETWNTLKGSALFFRSMAFFNLLQVYAVPYDVSDLEEKLGIPLRLTADVNATITRASLKESYDRLIADLEESIPLLPLLPDYKTRPSQAAAYGLLSRVYLVMRNYEKAKEYSDSCLSITGSLMDYNSLDPSKSRPIVQFNDEVILHSTQVTYGIRTDAYVNADIYASYDNNDLRKTIFVNNDWGVPIFKGWYTGSSRLFSGIATDELYLNRAECYARMGDKDKALDDLNLLLRNRFVSGTFSPVTASSAAEALVIILNERRKELLFRNTRWSDLRRLNKETAFATTLTRTLNGSIYTLPPNDPRYTYPIPPDEILISQIPQNTRQE